jgi:hypothetical protein
MRKLAKLYNAYNEIFEDRMFNNKGIKWKQQTKCMIAHVTNLTHVGEISFFTLIGLDKCKFIPSGSVRVSLNPDGSRLRVQRVP